MHVEMYWSHSFIPDMVRPDGVVFDIGVNDGGFSRLIASRCRAVIGYEPDPRWRGRWQLPSNVTVVPAAIAATAGRLLFHVNTERCSSMHFADRGSESIDVDAVTLEQALATAPDARIDLLKMDIEGEEVAVLLQAPAHLFDRVVQMTIEFHDFLDPSQAPAIREVIARLEQLGFLAVCFSFRNYGDMLFVNQKLAPISAWDRAWLLARYKYARGLGRLLKRIGGG